MLNKKLVEADGRTAVSWMHAAARNAYAGKIPVNYAWSFPDVHLPLASGPDGEWETCSTSEVSGKIVRITVTPLPTKLGIPRGRWWGRWYPKRRTVVDCWPMHRPEAELQFSSFPETCFGIDVRAFLPTAFSQRIEIECKKGVAVVVRFTGRGHWLMTLLVELP